MRAALVAAACAAIALGAVVSARQDPSPPALDFAFFKARVQPIFLTKRPGHARCISCHSSGTPMRLQPLAAGSTTWSDDEARKNFEAVRRAVVPGSMESMLLIHPLATEAGGDLFHSGGKHWTSRTDPEWQTLAAWVRGEKLTRTEP